MDVPGLHFVDWIIFAIMLVLSIGIGIYHSFTGGKQKTTDEYLRGGQTIAIWPAILSLSVSFMSSVSMLGLPAEIYTFGGQFWLGTLGWTLGHFLSVLVYVPVLYPLQTTTANEYIELRFRSKVMRVVIGVYTIAQSLFYASIVTFGQATAIEAVSGFPVSALIVISTVAAVLYTTLGGLRGVVWTDVFQTGIMTVGLVIVVIMGFIKVGGISEVFKINYNWGRLDVFDFDPDPTKRINFWGVVFGNALTGASVYGHRQEGYQRYAAMPTINKANLVVMLSAPVSVVLGSLATLVGFSMFAYFAYAGCDPLKAGYVSNPNQLVPYFVMTVLNVPGLPGLFLACVSAAALSTISSVLNGSAAIAWSDVIKPHLKISDRKATTISKALVIIFGCGIIVLAIFVERLGGNIMQMLGTFSSAIAGPMAGVFLVGMFFPWSNWKGASLGCVLGSAFTLWVGFGSYSIDRHISKLPTNTANCTVPTALNSSIDFRTLETYILNFTTTTETNFHQQELTGIDRLYALSFLWMREVATSITIFVAMIFSFVTGATDPKKVESHLLHPWLRSCFPSDTAEIDSKMNKDEKIQNIEEMKTMIPPDSEEIKNNIH